MKSQIQQIYKYPNTDFSELRNHTESLAAPYSGSFAVNNNDGHGPEFPGVGRGNHDNANPAHNQSSSTNFREPSHIRLQNSNPSTLYAGAPAQTGMS